MENAYKTILVATDGSRQAENAFKKALILASLHGVDTKLIIAHVIDTPSLESMGAFDDTFLQKLTNESKNSLEELKQRAEKAGVKNVVTHLEYGSPKQAISFKIPKEYDADLVIIGSTGLNRFEKLMIGSVTSFVVRNAKTDVLVTR